MLALVFACLVPGLAALPCTAGPFGVSQAYLATAGWPLDMDLGIEQLIYLDEIVEVTYDGATATGDSSARPASR